MFHCTAGIIADRRKQLEEEIDDLMNRDEEAENKGDVGEDGTADMDTSRRQETDTPNKENTSNRSVNVTQQHLMELICICQEKS